MIIGKNNIKEIYNPGEIDFDTMTKMSDHGDKVFIWASDVNSIKYLPLNGESGDAIYAKKRDYMNQMKEISKDYICSVINVAIDMYNADSDHKVRGLELLESQEINIWAKLNRENTPLSSSLKNDLKNMVRNGELDFRSVSNINRIFAEIIVDNDTVFQRISFLPNYSTQLFRVGRLINNKWEFSIWQGEIWDYNFEQNQMNTMSRNYIRKRFLSKSDVEDYFESVLRWQDRGWNPNACIRKGFYTYSKLFTPEEFSNIQNLYSGIPLYAPDRRSEAETFIAGNIVNYDTYNEEMINNKKYRIFIQESEMMVQKVYVAKMHRLLKINKDDPNDFIGSNWEYIV